MKDSAVALLRQMPVFGGLKSETIETVYEQSDRCSRLAGEYFFRENDPADSLFVIETGTVTVEKPWKGTPVFIQRLEVGDCFGEMSLIDLQARSASVMAATDCQTIQISLKLLHDLYRSDVEQYAIILMNMGREVSRRLRVANDRLFELEQKMLS